MEWNCPGRALCSFALIMPYGEVGRLGGEDGNEAFD